MRYCHHFSKHGSPTARYIDNNLSMTQLIESIFIDKTLSRQIEADCYVVCVNEKVRSIFFEWHFRSYFGGIFAKTFLFIYNNKTNGDTTLVKLLQIIANHIQKVWIYKLLHLNKDDALYLYNYVFDKPYTHLDLDTVTNTLYKNFNLLELKN